MSSDPLERLLASDVHDPSDFPKTASVLRDLDAALRCNICGELYNAPVTLGCGHCFCSVCVREAIQVKAECPACRKTTIEGNIRSNPAMDVAVEAWKNSRALALRLCKEEDERRNALAAAASYSDSRKKRKRCTASDSTSPPKGGTSSPSPEITEISSDTLVDCPMCAKRVAMKRINVHIDSECLPSSPNAEATRSKGAQKVAWSKLLDGKGKGREKESEQEWQPLPKASYQVLKDKQLKDLLFDQQLPLSGDRNTWITRHQRWVLIWNANLDKLPEQRKSPSELRAELKKWEEQRSKAKKAPVVVDDPIEYEKAHKADFDRLIAAVKPKSRGSANAGEAVSRKQPDSHRQCPAADDDNVIIVAD